MTIKSAATLRLLYASLLLCAATVASADELYKAAPPLPGGLTIELFLPDETLLIDHSATTESWASMGLMGALMAKNLYEKDDARTAPRITELRLHQPAYDMRSRFEQAVRRKFLASGVAPDTRYIVLPHVEENDRANAAGAPMGTVLKVASRHALPYDLQEMYVLANVVLVERQRKSNGKVKERLLFRRTYAFAARLQPAFGSDPETNLSRWRAIGGSEMGRLLELSTEQATDIVAYDFSAAGRAEGAQRVSNRGKRFVAGEQIYGRMLREEPTWYWARTAYGDIQGGYPLEAKAQAVSWP